MNPFFDRKDRLSSMCLVVTPRILAIWGFVRVHSIELRMMASMRSWPGVIWWFWRRVNRLVGIQTPVKLCCVKIYDRSDIAVPLRPLAGKKLEGRAHQSGDG